MDMRPAGNAGPSAVRRSRNERSPASPDNPLFEGKANLQGDLVTVDLAVGDVAADLSDLEPSQMAERARSFGDRTLDGFGDADFGCADDFNDFIGWLRHFRPPCGFLVGIVVCRRRAPSDADAPTFSKLERGRAGSSDMLSGTPRPISARALSGAASSPSAGRSARYPEYLTRSPRTLPRSMEVNAMDACDVPRRRRSGASGQTQKRAQHGRRQQHRP